MVEWTMEVRKDKDTGRLFAWLLSGNQGHACFYSLDTARLVAELLGATWVDKSGADK